MQPQDNITWQKIQELKEVPRDISFDAAKVWQRMEAELQPKKYKKNYLTWLSIAAILLLIISTAVIYSNQDIKQTGSTEIVQPKKRRYVFNAEKELKTNTTLNIDQTTVRSKKNIKAPIIIKNSTIIDSIIFKQPSTEPIQNPVVTITPEIVITPQPVAAPIKKKLKVIHLNDLYQPIPEEIAKAEIKKQSNEEVAVETEPMITAPSKPFWKAKASQKTAITLNDNQ